MWWWGDMESDGNRGFGHSGLLLKGGDEEPVNAERILNLCPTLLVAKESTTSFDLPNRRSSRLDGLGHSRIDVRNSKQQMLETTVSQSSGKPRRFITSTKKSSARNRSTQIDHIFIEM